MLTPDRILTMARAAGLIHNGDDEQFLKQLADFAALVAAAEREACALVCDAETFYWLDQKAINACNVAGNKIRARGTTQPAPAPKPRKGIMRAAVAGAMRARGPR